MEMGSGSGMTCRRRLHKWQEKGVWERLHRALLDRLGYANAINWERAAVDSASVPAKGGPRNRAEPDRPRQAGFQASHPRRCQRYLSRPDHLRCQPARQQVPGGTGRCRAGYPPVCRPTTPSPHQTARRQGVRFRPLSARTAQTRHHSHDRPARHRKQSTPGPSPMGRRAHPGMVRPLPQNRRPLPTARRHLHCLPPHRSQPHLLEIRPEMVLLGALRPYQQDHATSRKFRAILMISSRLHETSLLRHSAEF